MRSIIRKDEKAVSPVIATILMVAITVVLAAVLYVMVSGLISGPGSTPTAWGVNIGRSGDQSNWTLTFTSIPSSAATSSVFITIRNAAGAAVTGATNVMFSTIANGGVNGYNAMYFTPNTASTVSTGDVLRLSAVSYPNGYTVAIVSGTSVVYTHALQ
jgi:flagellin-like protein